MNYQDRWLLPVGITEALPEEAAVLETLRRRFIDLFARWGYRLVIPPMIEYVESLLPPESGRNLELQTFKFTDQVNGRTLGIRADMTPQVARIDAHHLHSNAPNRLCYLGTVLHSRPHSLASSRSPMQMGAELYGYAGIAADAEIIHLMLAMLAEMGLTDFCVDIGHVRIYHALVEAAQLTPAQQNSLLAAMKRKAPQEVELELAQSGVDTPLRELLLALLDLNGEATILTEARQRLARAPAAVHQALDELETLYQKLPPSENYTYHFDLAESRGYRYHNGIIFAVYIDGQGQAIAKGGRYDGLCRYYGRDRAATGFSTNLRLLSTLAANVPTETKTAIFAPALDDPQLSQFIHHLRASGETVIQELPGQQGDADALGCQRYVHCVAGTWQVKNSTKESS
ncbi:ATP phosphoribosyltransferase regulatory subunit [Thioflexithrix psekupsensis]|uniref:ATP phosphoribosyltransferase regulatory subunit n=1 Tax=Thioflexithrix psekupsensis TaxID=1570016 RepID=A0A251X9I9_9GAMM|nr:ATP phosphoribosyltransferase regulatory subunit [Thioflexithrix psekupsensis]OUD14610.1 ATP phosphoribosyltransferase regulatory subunit [Thioflexithrix psekupsensis]